MKCAAITLAALFSCAAFIAIDVVGVGVRLALAEDAKATQASQPRSAKIELPTIAESKPRDFPGLHNVVAYHDGYFSGSVPEGNPGFDTLAALGIKTIITVDGAEPEVGPAEARGMRYIHLPIGYNGFDDARKLELVRATRDAMKAGPVYIHCHHGKHRSAGAAGTIAASLGWLTVDQALERMKVSGTAPNYTGLFACTANATLLDAKTIDAVPASFPSVSHPDSFVKSMLEMDEINDRLKAVENAGWTVPKDHSDQVPAAEAGRMADLFRVVSQTDNPKHKVSDFTTALRANSEQAQSLENMLVAGEKDPLKLSNQLKVIGTSCKDCHTKYRD